MKKIIKALLVIGVMTLSFTGCHDPIFEEIKNEAKVAESRLQGSINSFVEFNGYVWVAPAHSGKLYRKSASATTRNGWASVAAPKTPSYLASSGGSLYMIAVDFEEGSGDYEGYNIPVYYEYKSSDGVNWGSYIAKYDWNENSSTIPSMYKNQYCSATAAGTTYSIGSSGTQNYVSGNGSNYDKSDDTGRIWCLAGTSNNLLLGTNGGLWYMDSGHNFRDNVLTNSSAIFSSMKVFAIWVQDPTKPLGDSVIYAYGSPAGSTNATREGLYSYIDGKWDSEL